MMERLHWGLVECVTSVIGDNGHSCLSTGRMLKAGNPSIIERRKANWKRLQYIYTSRT